MQRRRYECQPRMAPIREPNGLHHFFVGARPLNCGSGNFAYNTSGACHVCFLLDNDLFEYGCPEFEKNYVRRRNVGKTRNFDWNKYSDRTGNTFATPDELEDAIISSGKWSGDQYNFMNFYPEPSHNCHDFVSFCLRFCAGNCGIAKKGINML